MDFVDFILKTIFQLFGWIFGGLLKSTVLLFVAIFSGIAGLFKKA